jgi:hypothetical protein
MAGSAKTLKDFRPFRVFDRSNDRSLHRRGRCTGERENRHHGEQDLHANGVATRATQLTFGQEGFHMLAGFS